VKTAHKFGRRVYFLLTKVGKRLAQFWENSASNYYPKTRGKFPEIPACSNIDKRNRKSKKFSVLLWVSQMMPTMLVA